MSLNKFSNEDNGYALKLNIGADTLKCNQLEVLGDIEQNGVPSYLSTYGNHPANWMMTNLATISGDPAQPYGYFQRGNYLRCMDNITILTPTTGTTFDMTFDLPSFVTSSLNGVMTMGTGKKSDGSGYTLMKYQSSTNGTTQKKTISVSKMDGSAFTFQDSINFSFVADFDLNQFP